MLAPDRGVALAAPDLGDARTVRIADPPQHHAAVPVDIAQHAVTGGDDVELDEQPLAGRVVAALGADADRARQPWCDPDRSALVGECLEQHAIADPPRCELAG